jgi:Cytochrome P460
MRLNSTAALLLGAAAALCILIHLAPSAKAAAANAPVYAANGDLLPVGNYREWIYLTSGIDMSYNPAPADMTMFDNVFVNPEAYRRFLATGTWPDKTMLVLETREAKSKGPINQHGHFQGTGLMGVEVHVKDEARFPGKWAFFTFDTPDKNGTLIPQGAPCYSCHAAHAAVDTTFVQFYPTLLPIAEMKKTFSESFLKDEATHAPAK